MQRYNLPSRSDCGGFTYFGILITVMLLGTALMALGSSWSIHKRRAAEAELIFVGQSFRKAIESYYNRTPGGANQYPITLEQLVSDVRGGKVARHLREIYRDPLTGERDWNLITLPNGSIIGVSSVAAGEPLKRTNFGPWEQAFENTGCFCDWQFVYLPQLVSDSSYTPET